MLAIEPGLKPILFDYNTWLDNMASKPLWALMGCSVMQQNLIFIRVYLVEFFVFLGSILRIIGQKQIKTSFDANLLWKQELSGRGSSQLRSSQWGFPRFFFWLFKN